MSVSKSNREFLWRRLRLAGLPLAACVLLAGCSSSGTPGAPSLPSPSTPSVPSPSTPQMPSPGASTPSPPKAPSPTTGQPGSPGEQTPAGDQGEGGEKGKAAAPKSEGERTQGEKAQGETGGAAKTQAGGAQTDAERQANLEERLEESLGEFDKTLMREQKVLAERREAAQEAAAARSAGGVLGGGASSGGEMGSSGELGTSGAENGGGATGSKPGGTETISEEEARAKGRIPPDIPDGSGDDIVARQLREAAMAEEDPELREKLWDEYRRYKAGQRKDDSES